MRPLAADEPLTLAWTGASCMQMVIYPCTMATISDLAIGAGDTLITRAAAVMIKERRPLIVVPHSLLSRWGQDPEESA